MECKQPKSSAIVFKGLAISLRDKRILITGGTGPALACMQLDINQMVVHETPRPDARSRKPIASYSSSSIVEEPQPTAVPAGHKRETAGDAPFESDADTTVAEGRLALLRRLQTGRSPALSQQPRNGMAIPGYVNRAPSRSLRFSASDLAQLTGHAHVGGLEAYYAPFTQ